MKGPYEGLLLRRVSLLFVMVGALFSMVACDDSTTAPTAPSALPAPPATQSSVSPLSSALLSVELLGSGKGTVTSDVGGIACRPNCNSTFASNTVVTLTATAGKNSKFAGWTDDCSGTSLTTTVTMSQDRRCTASFSRLADDRGAPGPDMADLVVSGIAGSVDQGVFFGTVWVKNVGTVQAVASHTRIFFSRDRKLDSNDIPIGDVATPSLPPGAEDREIFQFSLPAGAGVSYYIIALADANAVVEESSETNNTRTSARM